MKTNNTYFYYLAGYPVIQPAGYTIAGQISILYNTNININCHLFLFMRHTQCVVETFIFNSSVLHKTETKIFFVYFGQIQTVYPWILGSPQPPPQPPVKSRILKRRTRGTANILVASRCSTADQQRER